MSEFFFWVFLPWLIKGAPDPPDPPPMGGAKIVLGGLLLMDHSDPNIITYDMFLYFLLFAMAKIRRIGHDHQLPSFSLLVLVVLLGFQA